MATSCDETCSKFGLSNVAARARSVVQKGDCSIIEHFLDQGIEHNGLIGSNSGISTECWTFGYVNVDTGTYFCATYSSLECGTKIDQRNNVQSRRLICSCGQGNK